MSAAPTPLPSAPFQDGPDARPKWWPLPLDKDLFNPDAEELAFFRQTTGIQDETELREHVTKAQIEAYKIFPYGCIRNYNFTKLKISREDAYPQMMALAKTRPDGVYLDLGCCFGNDARKAVIDGYPMKNVICSDLRPQYWDLGYELFRDRDTFHVPFIAGDAFDPAFLSPTIVEKNSPRTALRDVKTLTDLQGEVSVIHTSSFFHLFDKQQQETLAHVISTLLLKKSGSLIFGSHGGNSVPGNFRDRPAYGHSAESWTELWESVLGKGKCEVKAELGPWKGAVGDPRGDRELLMWSVTLL